MLLSEVSKAQQMPFLRDFPLPADMTAFLGPSGSLLLTKQSANIPHASNHKEKQQRGKKSSVKVKSKERARKVKEDLGVAVERGKDGAVYSVEWASHAQRLYVSSLQ